ncbi:hypothetical protein F0562_008401 [Nyssa sinensis]|uniref:Uncharacterized protein n=1 Tax=Nyssa sinensis TaxID=561372 RepID=A0A5J5A9A5_9ASTE|nr:hypothetical protein F0562_008401 [Nyssa sinensis]
MNTKLNKGGNDAVSCDDESDICHLNIEAFESEMTPPGMTKGPGCMEGAPSARMSHAQELSPLSRQDKFSFICILHNMGL